MQQRPRDPEDWHLIAFLTLFFACFQDQALIESRVEPTLHDFALLPRDDLIQAARGLGLELNEAAVAGWERRLDDRGQKALIAALYTAEWA